MKTIQYFLIITLLIHSIFSLQAQYTEGKEFWLTFGKNSYSIPIDLQIRIVGGKEKTTGTIYFTNLDTYEEFEIEPHKIFNHILAGNQMAAVYNTVMGKTNFSVHINTSNPVAVYAFNYMPNTTYDVTNILPVEGLGTDYYQISYSPWTISYDAFAVVATKDNTLLYHNGDLVEILHAGDVYYGTSDTDMTGNFICSNKPVAFFAVNQSSPIPVPLSVQGSHLFQQLAPVNTWDKTFFVPVSILEKNIVRIVASQNNTNITQLEGGTVRYGVPGAQTNLTNLQAGDFIELDIHIDDNGCFIKADKPVGVCSYFTLSSYSVFNSMPAQCWIPGINQKNASIILAPFLNKPQPIPKTHYALIYTSTAAKDSTKVSIGGGTPANLSGVWIDNPIVGMSFYNMPLINQNETYTFTNSNGFIILGYGVRTTGMGTYYYLAGSAMRDLDVAFYANDIHFQDLKYYPICEGLINFRAEIDGKGIEVDTVKWYINGLEEVTKRDSLEWSKPLSLGRYEIKMWVHFENYSTVSKTDTLIIKSCNQNAAFYMNEVHYLIDTTFCNKQVNFRAETGVLSTEAGHLRWFIDYSDGNGYVEESSALDQK